MTRTLPLLGLTLLAACGGSTPPTDGGGDDGGNPFDASHGSDATVVDTGVVIDMGGAIDAPITPGDASCTTDADGDGHRSITCGGDDCDDANPNRYPGNAELCDGIDQDCNPSTLGPDSDGDGFPSTTCCNPQPSAPILCGGDCDDTRATVNPSAAESCNGIDDNCNGMIDEGVTIPCWHDGDSDGYALASATSTMMCACGSGTTATNPATSADCNDTNPSVNPAATEVCNGIDDNCDGLIDPGLGSTFYRDADHDGHGDASMMMTACSAPAGYVASSDDCNDACATCFPGSTEVCDGVDNDCNGATDELILGSCMAGIGACHATGNVHCGGSCDAVVGTPDSGWHTTPAANGSWDWNCDGTLEGEITVASSSYYTFTSWCNSLPTGGCMAGYWLLTGAPSASNPYCGLSVQLSSCHDNGAAVTPHCVPTSGSTPYLMTQGCH